MTRRNLQLFGVVRVERDDGTVPRFRSQRTIALLGYLVAERRAVSRDALAALFWPDETQSRGRGSLRRELHNLSQILPGCWEADRQSVRFSPAAATGVDLYQFSEYETAGQWAEAAELVRGDFLEGLYLDDNLEFETWLLGERERWRQQAEDVLVRLVDLYTRQADYTAALKSARKLLQLTPWNEVIHRQVMLLLARTGQRGAAMKQYTLCQTTLQAELGVAVSAETTALYERIKRNATFTLHNLPTSTTPFIGREEELADIMRRLQEPACRLLTLVGPGGSGKTRLAIQAAQKLVDAQPIEGEFVHGIFFVPLQPVSTSSGVVSAIAEAANFHFYSDVPPRQQLLDYLRQKQLLLVLDNFEHLLPSPSLATEGRTEGGTALIGEILTQAPGVKLLVTSREGLNLQQEWFHPISGLPFPADDETDSSVDDFDALRLFAQSARRARVGFSLAAEGANVGRICRLVEGMPLALELAASWLKVVPMEKIAQEIERGLDILTTRQQNVPERHRSMRAVLEQSWDLLTKDEQDVLKRLSIFRGGFRQAGAEAVAGASLLTLAKLVEKSLLRATATGRYQMHELLRQFAAEKLAAVSPEEATTRENHSAYYLAFLQARETMLTGKAQRQALDEIGEEIDNVRLAWVWAVEQHNIEAIEQALESLYHFYQIRSRCQEGQELFAQAASQLQQAADLTEHPKFDLVRNMLSLRRGAFCLWLDDYEAAAQHLQVGLKSAKHQRELAFALRKLGHVANQQANRSLAEERLHKSLAISRELGDLAGVAEALAGLASVADDFGDHAQGKQLASEGLSIWRQLGRPDQVADALLTLAWPTNCLGGYGESEAYWQESLAIYREIGDPLGIAVSLNWLGWAAWCEGGTRLTEAIAFYDRALATYRELGHRRGLAMGLGDLALAASELGNYARAIQYGHEGLAMAKEIDDVHFIAYNLYCLGAATCGLGDLQASRNYLLEALWITWEALKSDNIMNILLYFATLLLKESELDDAPEVDKFQQPVTALELLALVIHHPAAWQAFKDRAARLQAQLEAELPAEVVATAKTRGESCTLDEVVGEILQGVEARGAGKRGR